MPDRPGLNETSPARHEPDGAGDVHHVQDVVRGLMKDAMDSGRMSQSEAARRLRVNHAYLSRWMSRSHGLGYDALARLVHVLGYRLDAVPRQRQRYDGALTEIAMAADRHGMELVPKQHQGASVTTSPIRSATLDDAIQHAQQGHRVLLYRDGHDQAAIVPVRDLALLRQLDSVRDKHPPRG